jgi:hypothetical protein
MAKKLCLYCLMAAEALSLETVSNIALEASVALTLGAAGVVTYMRSRTPIDRRNDFSSLERQLQVRGDAESAVTYIHEQGIGAVALLDTSARPFYVPLIHEWNGRFDPATDPRPPIFFLNPRGFRSKELSPRFNVQAAMGAFYDRRPYELPRNRRHLKEIAKALPKEYPTLGAHREEPVLVIDTCAHSGGTAAHVFGMMHAVGFKDVRFMAGFSELGDKEAKALRLVVLNEEEPFGGCYPWGQDFMAAQTYRSARPLPERRKKQRAASVALRQSLHAVALRPAAELHAEVEKRAAEHKAEQAEGEPTP